MATSSITKEFYVRDQSAFEQLKRQLDNKPERRHVTDSPSLNKGRQKLATFVFR